MISQNLVSIILSFRNEEKNIEELVKRLNNTLRTCHNKFEYIFINDASTDQSIHILHKLLPQNPHIKIINMSRQFGQTQCHLAGFKYAQGDAIIYMDTDLQDPPEIIPELLSKWSEGYEVVHTTRIKREGESRAKMFLTKCAYIILHHCTKIKLPVECGDFKLLSKSVVEKILSFPESAPYLRGLVNWVGYKQTYIPYVREKRFAGKTHFAFNTGDPIYTFFWALTSFSTLPLYLPLAVFVLILLATITFITINLTGILQWKLPKIETLGLIFLIISSLQFLFLGIFGVYLSKIHINTMKRPPYLINNFVGFNSTNLIKNKKKHNEEIFHNFL